MRNKDKSFSGRRQRKKQTNEKKGETFWANDVEWVNFLRARAWGTRLSRGSALQLVGLSNDDGDGNENATKR